jgi:DHA2 family multidrug resistance protein
VFSTRWLFTASAVGFTLTSMLCGLAWNIDSMILFRGLQGMLGASMIPTVFTSSFHYFQGNKRVYAAAVIGTIASVAPTIGPMLGGYITDALNWHWLFYINLIPGTLVAIGVALLVDIDNADLKLLRQADYPGIALMAAGLGTLEYFLEEGTRWNWFSDSTITACAWIAGLCLLAFFIRSMVVANPVVDFRAFYDRNFALGCFLSFVTGIGIFSTVYLTPLFLGYVRGYSAWQTGTALISLGTASILGVPVYILLARKLDLRWIMMFGLACFGLSMWCFAFITSDWGAHELFLPQVIRGFPQVFCVAPAVTLGLGSLSPARLKYASGLFNMMRNLGGAVGIAVCGAVLNSRTNFHFQALASGLTEANAPMRRLLAGMTSRLSGTLDSPVAGHAAALRELWALTYAQAQTLAYADAFRAVMVAFAVAACLVPLMRKVAAPAAPAEGH